VVDEEEEEEAAEEESLLSLSTKLSYGAPQFATMSLTFLINVYGNRFYAQMGAQLSALAFFTALARSLDVITDPFMGWFSDNTRTSYGRRRPFVFFGCPFYGVFFILLMSPPDGMGEEGIAMWFGLFYVCFYLSDTLSNIPYYGAISTPIRAPIRAILTPIPAISALGPELTQNYEDRSRLFFVAKLFYFIGMLFAAMAPPMLLTMLRASTPEDIPCGNVYNGTSFIQPHLRTTCSPGTC